MEGMVGKREAGEVEVGALLFGAAPDAVGKRDEENIEGPLVADPPPFEEVGVVALAVEGAGGSHDVDEPVDVAEVFPEPNPKAFVLAAPFDVGCASFSPCPIPSANFLKVSFSISCFIHRGWETDLENWPDTVRGRLEAAPFDESVRTGCMRDLMEPPGEDGEEPLESVAKGLIAGLKRRSNVDPSALGAGLMSGVSQKVP